jgi:hypothetical protein
MKKHLPKIIILATLFTFQSTFSAAEAPRRRSKLSATAPSFVLLSARAKPFVPQQQRVFVPLKALHADQKEKFIEDNLPLLNTKLPLAERLAAGHAIFSDQEKLHSFNSHFLSHSLHNSDETIKACLRKLGQKSFPKELMVQGIQTTVTTVVAELPNESITSVHLELTKQKGALPAELNASLTKARGFPIDHISWIHGDYADIQMRILQKTIAQREQQIENERNERRAEVQKWVRQTTGWSVSTDASLTLED